MKHIKTIILCVAMATIGYALGYNTESNETRELEELVFHYDSAMYYWDTMNYRYHFNDIYGCDDYEQFMNHILKCDSIYNSKQMLIK